MKTRNAILIVAVVVLTAFFGWRYANNWGMEAKADFDARILDKYTVWRDIDPQTKERIWVAEDSAGRRATSTTMPLLAIQDLERSRQTFQFSPEGGLEGGTGQ
jgi:hypothetical protein